MKTCFCGSDLPYSACCGPIIKGTVKPASAERLMRSRYTAYVMAAVDHLYETTHISQRAGQSKTEIAHWAKSNNWRKLEIVKADTFTVEFKAHYTDRKGKKQVHHELSTFVFEGGTWFYLSGIYPSQ